MRRLLAILALVSLLALGPLAGTAVATPAQADDQETTTTTAPQGGDIIPQPNSGAEPEDAGDRGGALQTGLFIGLVGVIVVVGAVIVRQSRAARAERGF